MKTDIPLLTLVGILFLFTSFTFRTSESAFTDGDDFAIHFTIDGNLLVMECKEGCFWDKLEFTADANTAYYISNEKMLSAREVDAGGFGPEIKFVFSVTLTENGLSFVGHKGVSWLSLSAFCQKSWSDCLIELSPRGVSVR